MPFSDAITTRGTQFLGEGRRRLDIVAVVLQHEGATDELHAELVEVAALLRRAMDWLEDTPRFELAHKLLDEAGALRRTRFPKGCELLFKQGGYHQRCPVALAHSRVGMSASYVIEESECSICGLNPDECEHISGFVYEGRRRHIIVTQATLLEISIVSRPNQPDARVESVGMPLDDLYASLGSRFELGTPIVCDKCLRPCEGVVSPFED